MPPAEVIEERVRVESLVGPLDCIRVRFHVRFSELRNTGPGAVWRGKYPHAAIGVLSPNFGGLALSTAAYLSTAAHLSAVVLSADFTMGRRAKNKQGDPTPLQGSKENGQLSQKKLGKRKADPEAEHSKRPTKKVKEVTASPTKSKVPNRKVKPRHDATLQGKSKKVAFEGDVQEGGSSDGWEGVDDDTDLTTAAM